MVDVPTGERFSHVYLREATLLPDSARLRRRLGVLYGTFEDHSEFGAVLEAELGIYIGYIANKRDWPELLSRLELKDVLDSVTIRWRRIFVSEGDKLRKIFLIAARRIFSEEQVRYQIDDQGGVHFTVDSDFEYSRISTIARLGKQRYTSVRKSYEEAFSALDRTPPDGKAAIRSGFFSAEGLFRLMFPKAHQLSTTEVQKYLKPLVDRTYDRQKHAISLAQKQVAAFSSWIEGAHFYRHEPGTEEPAQPPLSLAIYMVAQTGAHIRWLVELDDLQATLNE